MEGFSLQSDVIIRYYSREAIQVILQIAAGNGVGRVWVAQHGMCLFLSLM